MWGLLVAFLSWFESNLPLFLLGAYCTHHPVHHHARAHAHAIRRRDGNGIDAVCFSPLSFLLFCFSVSLVPVLCLHWLFEFSCPSSLLFALFLVRVWFSVMFLTRSFKLVLSSPSLFSRIFFLSTLRNITSTKCSLFRYVSYSSCFLF